MNPHVPLIKHIKTLIYCLLILSVITFNTGLVLAGDKENPVYKAPKECSKYVTLVESYAWDTAMALKIIDKESGCNTKAVNSHDIHKGCIGSYGIFQVGCLHVKNPETLKDANTNIKVAYQVYMAAGGRFGRDWSTCKLIFGCW